MTLPDPKLTVLDLVGKSRDGLYEPLLQESEREAVSDLLQYLEHVGPLRSTHL
jgi:hypothetical protein